MTWCNKTTTNSHRITTLHNPLPFIQTKLESSLKIASTNQIHEHFKQFFSSVKTQVNAHSFKLLHLLNTKDESLEKNFLKMCKNSIKAMEEHRFQAYQIDLFSIEEHPLLIEKIDRHSDLGCLVSVNELNKNIEKKHLPDRKLAAINPKIDFRQTRNTISTLPCFQELEKGLLVGLFQSKEDRNIARIALNLFQKLFPKKLNEFQGDVYETFEYVNKQIHLFIINKQEWQTKGCTYLVSYIDLKAGLVYTSSLGRGEANLYRKFKRKTKSIPLSCVRNWSSLKDAKRAAAAYHKPEIVLEWHGDPHPQHLQCKGLNFSRALGYSYANIKDLPLVIYKSKITVQRIFHNDILTWVSSEAKENVSEFKTVRLIEENHKSLSKAILKKALKKTSEEMAAITLKF